MADQQDKYLKTFILNMFKEPKESWKKSGTSFVDKMETPHRERFSEEK